MKIDKTSETTDCLQAVRRLEQFSDGFDGEPGKSIRSNNPALLSAAVSDAGTGVEYDPLKKYRLRAGAILGRALEEGRDKDAHWIMWRIRRVVERAGH